MFCTIYILFYKCLLFVVYLHLTTMGDATHLIKNPLTLVNFLNKFVKEDIIFDYILLFPENDPKVSP